jgi:hypothetical protein
LAVETTRSIATRLRQHKSGHSSRFHLLVECRLPQGSTGELNPGDGLADTKSMVIKRSLTGNAVLATAVAACLAGCGDRQATDPPSRQAEATSTSASPSCLARLGYSRPRYTIGREIPGTDYVGAVAPDDRPQELTNVYRTGSRAAATRVARSWGGQAFGRVVVVSPPTQVMPPALAHLIGHCLDTTTW